ncbi:MAG: DUF805 domain-containing protein [Bacteroidota bacterium]
MEWYLKALRQYADFRGRARRKEYWMYILFHLMFICAFVFLGVVFENYMGSFSLSPMLLGIYVLGTIIPTFAVLVRRLHDTNRSGWNFLIRFIPLIGDILLLVFLVDEGDPGPNRYGPDPKEESVFDRIDEIGEYEEY